MLLHNTTLAPYSKEESPSQREIFRATENKLWNSLFYNPRAVIQEPLHWRCPILPAPALTAERRIDWETAGSAQSADSYEFALGPEWAQSVRTCC